MMMDQPTGLFDLAERRLGWLSARQKVLAQNIANADTPAYGARDLAPFADMVGRLGIEPARTNPLHLAGFIVQTAATQLNAAERAPDGNAVSLENQLSKVADDETTQALVGNIWHSYMGMFMTALGHAS